MSGTLVTIAKDVKIQVEFNPAQASAYRLIGYENRMLRKEDFNNDAKDAGEIGAGHTVTALYEIVPVNGPMPEVSSVDHLKYQTQPRPKPTPSPELMTVKLRYKLPDGATSRLMTVPVTDKGLRHKDMSRDFRFACAVASFGMVLRNSEHRGNATFSSVQTLAAAGTDGSEYRREFIELAGMAASLAGQRVGILRDVQASR